MNLKILPVKRKLPINILSYDDTSDDFSLPEFYTTPTSTPDMKVPIKVSSLTEESELSSSDSGSSDINTWVTNC